MGVFSSSIYLTDFYVLFIRICQFFERIKRAFDSFCRYAVGNTCMSRTAETGSRNDEDIKLFCSFTESNVIFFQCLREDVEGSVRFYYIKTNLAEPIVKEIAVGLIDGDVGSHICTHGTYALEKSGCIDISKGTACTCNSCVHQSVFLDFIRNKNVSQTFSRKGEGLGPGIAHQSIVVVFRKVRNLNTIEHDLAIRLIRDQVDRMAQFSRFCVEDLRKFCAGLM